MHAVEASGFVAVVLASAGVFLFAGVAQAVTGFGLALAAVPILSLFLETGSAVVGTVAGGAVMMGFVCWRERHHVEVVVARRLSTAAVAGMPIGFVAIALLSESMLTLVICVVVLGLVVALARDMRLPSGTSTQWIAGVTSGALLTSTSMNGPPLVLALHGARMAPRRFRATLQAVFCIQGVIGTAGFIVLGHVDTLAAAVWVGACCGIWPGWQLGDRLFGLMSPVVFRRVILAGLALTAVVAFVTRVL